MRLIYFLKPTKMTQELVNTVVMYAQEQQKMLEIRSLLDKTDSINKIILQNTKQNVIFTFDNGVEDELKKVISDFVDKQLVALNEAIAKL